MLFQYQRLAQQIADKIKQQEYLAHQKLSSLRQFASQHAISLNTAKACYALLEAQGFIYVKERSGYYVKEIVFKNQQLSHKMHLPIYPDFSSHARSVSNLDLQIEIQNASIHPQRIHLGAIQLSPALIPIKALRRSIQRALKHSHPEDFLYSDRQGHIKLRQALSMHWAEDGLFITPDSIYMTNGCMAALSVLIQTLTQEGDSIIVPMPNYNGQQQLLANLKRKIIEIPASDEGIDLIRLEQVLQQSNARCCLLTANYQNPLGYCLTQPQKEKIAQLAHQYACTIIEDDIYAECCFSFQRPLPIQHWDQHGYVILCSSISKSLSSAYRVGWYCLPERYKHLHSQLMTDTVTVNTPLQLGLADLIYSRAYREHLNQLRPQLMKQVHAYREYLLQVFAEIPIKINLPQGGYSLWIQLPKMIDSLDCYYFAQQHQINIVPGEVFGEDHRYRNFIRLNAGYALSYEICKAIQLLAHWVREKYCAPPVVLNNQPIHAE